MDAAVLREREALLRDPASNPWTARCHRPERLPVQEHDPGQWVRSARGQLNEQALHIASALGVPCKKVDTVGIASHQQGLVGRAVSDDGGERLIRYFHRARRVPKKVRDDLAQFQLGRDCGGWRNQGHFIQ